MLMVFQSPTSSRHRTLAAVLSATIVIAGCTNVPTTALSGNYTVGSTEVHQKLALDTVRQLHALFPPASTRFDIAQPAADSFGIALVTGLREKGYAVMESSAVSTANRPSSPGEAARQSKPPATGLVLRYLIDSPGTDNLYRVSLQIGNGSLSRAYLSDIDGVQAAGAWVRKE
jgi:hypothetical protein